MIRDADVARLWGVGSVVLEEHDDGMNSRTWWATLPDGEHVAKWVPDAEAAHLRAGVAAARLAGADGLAVGTPLPRPDGSLWASADRGCLVLLERVPGRELTGDDPGDQQRIGATLAPPRP